MGYRSEVILAIAPEAAPAFMAMCAKYPKVLELCNEADIFRSGYESEGDWFMFWPGIKWYDCDEDVDQIQRFVEALCAADMTDYGEDEQRPGLCLASSLISCPISWYTNPTMGILLTG